MKKHLEIVELSYLQHRLEMKPSFFWTVIKTKRISNRTECAQICIKHFSMPKKKKRSVIVINKGRSPFIKTYYYIYYFQPLSTYRVKFSVFCLSLSGNPLGLRPVSVACSCSVLTAYQQPLCFCSCRSMGGKTSKTLDLPTTNKYMQEYIQLYHTAIIHDRNHHPSQLLTNQILLVIRTTLARIPHINTAYKKLPVF